MTLWLILALMAIGVVAILAGPSLVHRNHVPSGRRDFDIAVYKDQLNEVERDVERGHTGADQADAVRLEIQRRLLAAADVNDMPGSHTLTQSPVIIILALFIPLVSGLFYLQVGSPEIPDFPYAERGDLTAVVQGAAEMNDMVAGLEARLATNPDDPEGWAMLGRTYQVLERFAESANAFGKLYDLTGDVRARSEYAEALILANDAVVSAEIIHVLEQILRTEPLDPKARFYSGVGAAQQGNLAGAVQIWTDLVHLSPAGSWWLPAVYRQIEDAAKSAGIDPASVSPTPEVQKLAIAAGIKQGSGSLSDF